MSLADILNNPVLQGILYALDTPGALTRGAIGNLGDLMTGEDRAPGYRATGREMLEALGVLGPNQEGFDAGDVAGFGADVLVDPLNFVGAGLLSKTAKARTAAKASNTLREARLATGGMPEEIARLTQVVDEAGQPARLYHGTAHVYDKIDPAKWYEGDLYGPGHYMTRNPEVATSYTQKSADEIGRYQTAYDKRLQQTIDDAYRHPEVQDAWSRDYTADFMPDDIQFGNVTPGIRPPFPARDLDALTQEERVADLLHEYMFFAPLRERVQQRFPSLADALERVKYEVPAPLNVRTSYLDARRPFDVDAMYPAEELSRITGQAFERAGPGQGVFALHANKANAVQALQDAGYDAIRHTGGQVTGNPAHDVWIALNPDQVYSPWVAPAQRAVPRTGPLASALAAYEMQKTLPRAD